MNAASQMSFGVLRDAAVAAEDDPATAHGLPHPRPRADLTTDRLFRTASMAVELDAMEERRAAAPARGPSAAASDAASDASAAPRRAPATAAAAGAVAAVKVETTVKSESPTRLKATSRSAPPLVTVSRTVTHCLPAAPALTDPVGGVPSVPSLGKKATQAVALLLSSAAEL